VTSSFFLERFAKVILHGTLATTVRLYNISTLCNRNKRTNVSFFGKLEEPHAVTTPDL